MRAIIGLNSAVAMAPEELHWWTRFFPRRRRTGGDRAWPAFLDRFVDRPETQGLGLDRDELRARLAAVPPDDHAAVFATAMRAFAARLGKPRWGEKTLRRHHGRLPPRRIRIVEWLLGAEMQRLGYEPESPGLGLRETVLLPFELAGAAGDATIRGLDRALRGVPR